ncbi:MAG: RNA polymerase sigma factor [Patescibacteria group bacterium]
MSSEHHSDEEILKLSIRDPEYFGIIVERYEMPFLKKAFDVMRNKTEAEDIVQETFTKIYLNAGRFRKQENASFKSWAYRILMNTAFTHYQKAKKSIGRTEYIDAVGYDTDAVVAPSHDVASIADAKVQVAEIIAKMPEHLGRLLKLYYLDDMSYHDIAKQENIPLSTLKMRLFRAKRIFKKMSY